MARDDNLLQRRLDHVELRLAEYSTREEWINKYGEFLGNLKVVGTQIELEPVTSGCQIKIKAQAGNLREIRYQSGNLRRWSLLANMSGEGGGNQGSDFEIRAYADDASDLGTYLDISRASGLVHIYNNLVVGGSINTNSTAIEINSGGSGNRYAFIDFHGDDTYTDYGLRIIRQATGPNANSEVYHRGTGTFKFVCTDGGVIQFYKMPSITHQVDTGNIWHEIKTGSADTASLRLQASGSTGFGAYIRFYNPNLGEYWYVGQRAENHDFWIESYDGSNWLVPFKIFEGAPNNTLQILSDGDIALGGKLGIGTTNPDRSLHIAAASPEIIIEETDASADEKKWRFVSVSGSFYLQAVNDALSSADTAIYFDRSGASVTAIRLNKWTRVMGNSLMVDDEIYTEQWQDYSSTSTITGWSSFTTKQLNYKKVGNTVFVQFQIVGTSNSSSVSFTLPHSSVAGAGWRGIIHITNNGANNVGYYHLNASANTVNVYKDVYGGSWTSSGTKAIRGEFSYQAS